MKNQYLIIGGCLVFAFVVNYLLNLYHFTKGVKGKKTEKLFNHLMYNTKLKGGAKKRLFNYITKKRGSHILKPIPLTKDQIKALPKGKHFVVRKKQMKKK